MSFVFAYDYFVNCRGHDAGDCYGCLIFKNTMDEVFQWALENMHDSEILNVYDVREQKIIMEFSYETSGHRCSGIKARVMGEVTEEYDSYRTVDDGHGKLKWEYEGHKKILNGGF